MKVSSSIRSLYNQQVELNKRLQRKVNEIFSDGNNGRWFYKGRVKELESFTQKIETGRFNPDILEDFFACSLVVENRSAISEARELVEKYCEIISQKPADPKFTFKKPDSFAFDDLRMYVKLKKSDRIPPNDLNDITFEIQIKTFLQYAWGIATHDLIYKGDTISWSKARLAFQIKAMLEHAEISIEQVELVAASSSLDMSNKETEALLDILKWLNEQKIIPNILDMPRGFREISKDDLIQIIKYSRQ